MLYPGPGNPGGVLWIEVVISCLGMHRLKLRPKRIGTPLSVSEGQNVTFTHSYTFVNPKRQARFVAVSIFCFAVTPCSHPRRRAHILVWYAPDHQDSHPPAVKDDLKLDLQ